MAAPTPVIDIGALSLAFKNKRTSGIGLLGAILNYFVGVGFQLPQNHEEWGAAVTSIVILFLGFVAKDARVSSLPQTEGTGPVTVTTNEALIDTVQVAHDKTATGSGTAPLKTSLVLILAASLVYGSGCAAMKDFVSGSASAEDTETAAQIATFVAFGGCSLLPPAMRDSARPKVTLLASLSRPALVTELENPPPKTPGNSDQLVYSMAWATIKLALARFTTPESWLAAMPAVAESAIHGCAAGLESPVY